MVRYASKTQRWLMAAVLLTLLLLVAHPYLPERTRQLVPQPEQARYLYYDEVEGGGTRGEWLDEQGLAFACERVDPDKPSTYCGLSVMLAQDADRAVEGIDLSGFDSLRLDMTAQTSQPRLSLILRNYNPAYSAPGDANSHQHNAVTLRSRDLDGPLTVELSEFAVSEWWLINRDISREYTSPQMDNVTILGVDLRDRMKPGKHSVRLRSITAVGQWVSAETWYLVIILAWLLGAFVYLANRTYHWSRRARGRERQLQKLANRHMALRGEARSLKHLSERDALSGLLNRHGLAEVVAKLDLESDWPTSLILLDIDYFKRINDKWGHTEGDRVIRDIARLIETTTRGPDYLARWGGEEFLLVCPRTNATQAGLVAEKLRRRIAGSVFLDGSAESVSASLGVAQWGRGETFDQVLERADENLYRAKNQGRNRTVVQNMPA